MGRTLNLKNVIYFANFNSCGGVETFCYEMGLKYGKDYDITVLYQKGDGAILSKISKVARVLRYRAGDEIICDTFFFGYDRAILKSVKAKKCVQMFHTDFWARNIPITAEKTATHFVSVSKTVAESAKGRFDKEIEVIYNPYTPKKPRKVLNLISATRLTPEKGMERMKKLADALDNADIPFHWDIYTDIKREFPNKSVSVLPCRTDIVDFIANADYLVQLSDSESYSYSTVEALTLGTPVIVTDLPVLREIGVENEKNGFILPLDMSNIPVEKIYKGLKRFEYTPKESRYETILAKGKAEFDDSKMVCVRCKRHYFDVELDCDQYPNDMQMVTWGRAGKLSEIGVAEVI